MASPLRRRRVIDWYVKEELYRIVLVVVVVALTDFVPLLRAHFTPSGSCLLIIGPRPAGVRPLTHSIEVTLAAVVSILSD